MQSAENRMIKVFEPVREWMGWCPNPPVVHTAPAVFLVQQETARASVPGGGGSAGGSGGIRSGIRIAAGSIRALYRDRQLLWFAAAAGLVMLVLIGVEEWIITHTESSLPFLVALPLADTNLVIDTRLFLIEGGCLFWFTFLLAGIFLFRNGRWKNPELTIREAVAGVHTRLLPLGALSAVLAVAGTLLCEIISQNQFSGRIIFSITMAVFHLPYAYYLPDDLSGALWVSFKIMAVTMVMIVPALALVPHIVLEKGLFSALAGVSFIRKVWRRVLGCGIVFGVILLGVFALALLIGQSPLLLNHDYDFFLQASRGQILMTGICYGFIAACWALMAGGLAAMGIAATDICTAERALSSGPER